MSRYIPIIIVLILLFINNKKSLAQINEVAVPYSITYKLREINEFTKMPYTNRLKMLKEDDENKFDRLKKKRFAKMIRVSYTPENSGTWEQTCDGSVWRLGIHSEEAYSLYEVFGRFMLNKGVRLFVYNSDKTDFAGAFTHKNNNTAKILTVAPVAGERIIIELNIPAGISGYGELELTKVGHDYINEFGNNRLKISFYEPSESCNIDISCKQGQGWQTVKNAVCRVMIDGLLCTGTLINNVEGDKIPYLLTACHCVGDSASAAIALFFFCYERPECHISGNEYALAMSGSSLIATTNRLLDFTLLKLFDYPPANYKPYFAGLDAENTNPKGGVCIHHPNGDVKKISVDNDDLISGDFGEGFDSLSHWQVLRWDAGSTQGGSSGSPFFNKDQRLCGTLSGGDASCSNPVNDFFLKMNLAWNGYPDSVNQLKCWLDPKNTGTRKYNGVYPYGSPGDDFNTYSNSKGEYYSTYQNNLEWGTIAGHNSANYTQFAEKFYAPAPMKIKGIYLRVADRYPHNGFSIFSLKIWDGSSVPGTEIYTQDVYYKSLVRSANNIYYFDSPVTVTDTFFVGYSINYNVEDTTFIAGFVATDRGIGGSSTMYLYDGTWKNINEVTMPQINTSLALGVISEDGIDPTLKVRRELRIVPNPCTDYLFVEFSYDAPEVTVQCYNIAGKKVEVPYQRVERGYRLNTSNLPSGIYSLVVQTGKYLRKGYYIVFKPSY